MGMDGDARRGNAVPALESAQPRHGDKATGSKPIVVGRSTGGLPCCFLYRCRSSASEASRAHSATRILRIKRFNSVLDIRSLDPAAAASPRAIGSKLR